MTEPRRPAGRLQPVAAVLAAAAPLVAVVPWVGVLGGDWMPLAVAMVATMAIGSAIARVLTRSPFGTLAATLVAIAWCTWTAAREEALLGVVPTPDAIGRAVTIASEGIHDVLWTPDPPVPASEGLVLVVLVAVAVLALAIDALVLVAGLPALAIGLMLLPVLLPMAYYVEIDPLRLAPAAIVAAALLVTRRRRGVERGAERKAPAVVAVAAVAVVAIVTPLVLPSPRTAEVAWQRWFPSSGTGQGVSGGAVVLSTGIDLASDLERGVPVPVLDYEPSDGLPLRVRLTSLQGVSDSGFVEQPGSLAEDFSDLGGLGPGDEISTRITLHDATVGNAPLPEQPLATDDFAGDWRWDAATQSVGFEDEERVVRLDGTVYDVTSLRAPPLSELPADAVSTGHADERVVPEEAARTAALVEDIVDMSSLPAERAEQLYAYLTDDSWTYSEDVPFEGFGTAEGGGWAVLDAFMTERVGYCVHYATAMALLARAAGIPARVTVGFLPGDDLGGDGSYTVTTNDMHAWAELWFDDYGWVPFDTTPAVAAGGSVASAPDDVETGATEQPDLPTPTPTPSDAPSASPTPSASAEPDETSEASQVPDGRTGGVPGWLWWLAALALAVLLLGTPALVRGVLRGIRLRDGPGGAWEEVQATLADVGHRVPRSATAGELEAEVRARVRLDDAASAALSRLRAGAEEAVFGFALGRVEAGALDAEQAADAALRDDVALMRRAIVRGERPLARLSRWLAPGSLWRLWSRSASLDEGVRRLR